MQSTAVLLGTSLPSIFSKNADGAGETWHARVILADIDEGTWEISVGDVDGDGDLDVLTASRWSRDTMVAWPWRRSASSMGWMCWVQ